MPVKGFSEEGEPYTNPLMQCLHVSNMDGSKRVIRNYLTGVFPDYYPTNWSKGQHPKRDVFFRGQCGKRIFSNTYSHGNKYFKIKALISPMKNLIIRLKNWCKPRAIPVCSKSTLVNRAILFCSTASLSFNE